MLSPTARVSDRHLVYLAASRVLTTRVASTSRVAQEINVEVLAAFGGAVLVHGERVAFGSLTRKLKQLYDFFQAAPRSWDEFKVMLGVRATSVVETLSELPGKIKTMVREAEKHLRTASLHLLKIPVVKIFMDVAHKLPAVNDLIQQVVAKLPPQLRSALEKIKSTAKTVAGFMDDMVSRYKALRPMNRIASAAVFTFIWFNVVEFTWDIPAILRGFLGAYSWSELLLTLPESAIGFLLRFLLPGLPGGIFWNAFLPATLALRIWWLQKEQVVEWAPGKLVAHFERLDSSLSPVTAHL